MFKFDITTLSFKLGGGLPFFHNKYYRKHKCNCASLLLTVILSWSSEVPEVPLLPHGTIPRAEDLQAVQSP